jgi:hypothetical protein
MKYKDQQRPEYQSKTQHKERLLSAVYIAKAKVAIIYVSVDGYFILLVISGYSGFLHQ